MKGIRFYTRYLSGKKRGLYRELANRHGTSPWVIYRLLNGTRLRSAKELYIYRELMKEKQARESRETWEKRETRETTKCER